MQPASIPKADASFNHDRLGVDRGSYPSNTKLRCSQIKVAFNPRVADIQRGVNASQSPQQEPPAAAHVPRINTEYEAPEQTNHTNVGFTQDHPFGNRASVKSHSERNMRAGQVKFAPKMSVTNPEARPMHHRGSSCLNAQPSEQRAANSPVSPPLLPHAPSNAGPKNLLRARTFSNEPAFVRAVPAFRRTLGADVLAIGTRGQVCRSPLRRGAQHLRLRRPEIAEPLHRQPYQFSRGVGHVTQSIRVITRGIAKHAPNIPARCAR